MAYARRRAAGQLNRECLDDLAANALERETLTREDLDEIFDAHRLERRLVPTAESQPPLGMPERRGSDRGEVAELGLRRGDPEVASPRS